MISETVYDLLSEQEKMKYYWCPRCKKFFDKDEFEGSCLCTHTLGK